MAPFFGAVGALFAVPTLSVVTRWCVTWRIVTGEGAPREEEFLFPHELERRKKAEESEKEIEAKESESSEESKESEKAELSSL